MTLIDRYKAERVKAERRGDRGLVKEIDFMLRRMGWRPDATPEQEAVVEARAEADVRPARRPYTRRHRPEVP